MPKVLWAVVVLAAWAKVVEMRSKNLLVLVLEEGHLP